MFGFAFRDRTFLRIVDSCKRDALLHVLEINTQKGVKTTCSTGTRRAQHKLWSCSEREERLFGKLLTRSPAVLTGVYTGRFFALFAFSASFLLLKYMPKPAECATHISKSAHEVRGQ